MFRPKRTLAVIAFTLASCSSQLVPVTTPPAPLPPLRLYVAAPAAGLVSTLTTAYSLRNTDVTFEVIAVAERAAREALGDPNAYAITHHLDENFDGWAAPIGQDGIALIAHPSGGVQGLSLKQLRAIYSGELTQWSQIGGESLPIVVFTREDGAGVQDLLIRQVMGSARMDSNIRIAPSDAAMRFAVERTPGALGYVPISQLDGTALALTLDGATPSLDALAPQAYPLRMILYVAGAREPNADDPLGRHYRAFIGWVQSPEGQALVARHVAPLSLD
ncbi:MAG: substrate-binding domain-containing protein [Anaerolineae bacterium]|nr:substrate-binding domain-containing protein [Anaerolineae bacterium]